MTSKSKTLIVLVGYYFISCQKNANAQFGDRTVSQSDCNTYCHEDCSKYFDEGSSRFSTCVTANVHCNCGLPWYGILIAAIASLFVVFSCCIFLFKFIARHKATPIGTVGGSYLSPFSPGPTILYSQQHNDEVPDRINSSSPYAQYPGQIFNEGFGNTNNGMLPGNQPPFNPSYTEHASAPSYNILSAPPTVSNPADAPPSYDEVSKLKQ